MDLCGDSGFGTAEIVSGLAVGIAASIAWAFTTWCIRLLGMWRTFGKYAGTYTQQRKFPLPADPGAADILTITADKSRLNVRFAERPGRSIHGEIIMNRDLPNRGEGHYDDVKDYEQLWGFWDVQIKDDDTLLVHTTYASTHDTLVLQGYVWRRIKTSA